MASNRALVSLAGPFQGVNAGNTGFPLTVSYIIISPDNIILETVGGTRGDPEELVIELSYTALDDVAEAVKAAVRVNETDSSLEVFLLFDHH